MLEGTISNDTINFFFYYCYCHTVRTAITCECVQLAASSMLLAYYCIQYTCFLLHEVLIDNSSVILYFRTANAR